MGMTKNNKMVNGNDRQQENGVNGNDKITRKWQKLMTKTKKW